MKSKRFFWLTLALLMALLLPPAPARAEDTYPLTVEVSPAGAGTVTGAGRYAPGENVTLTATANSNYVFDHWACDSVHVNLPDPGTTPTMIQLNDGFRGDTVTAVFKKITYPVTVTADPAEGGTVTGGGTYAPDETVTLTATANEGYRFKAWQVTEGNVTVGEDGTFTMPAEAVTVRAKFQQLCKCILHVVVVNGTGTGSGEYYEGVRVPITATFQEGWTKWGDWSCSHDSGIIEDPSSASTYFTYTGGSSPSVPHDITITLGCQELPRYALTVEGGSGSGEYYEGKSGLTLTADAPAEGMRFKGWEVQATVAGTIVLEDPTEASTGCTLKPGYQGGTVKATYELITYPLTVTADPPEGGTVTGGGNYAPNSDFELVATPNEGWTFISWYLKSGDVSVNDVGAEWIDGRTGSGFTGGSIVAEFDRINADVNIIAEEGGAVNSEDSRRYSYGDPIPLKATPDEGWVFDHWDYAIQGVTVADPHAAETTASVLISGYSYITACFKKITYPVTVTADPAEGGTVTGAGSYTKGQPVTLTATPAEGWQFKGWASEDVTVAANGTFTMPAKAVAVKAVFERTDRRYTVTVAETSRPADGQAYTVGETLTYAVTVTNEGNVPLTGIQVPDELNGARKAAGESATTGWTTGTLQPGESQTFNGQHVITLADALAGTLTFGGMTVRVVTPSFPVTVACDPAEGGTVTGGGTYAPDETVTLTATANEGYRFKAWQVTEGNVTVGEDGTFVMPAEPVAVTAKFVVTYTLSGKAPGRADVAWAGLPRKAAERERISLVLHFPSASYEAGYRLNAVTLTDDAGNVTRLIRDAAGRTLREEAPLPGADGVSSYTFSLDMPASNVVAAAEFVRMTLRWYDGDASVLDEKYFFLGEPEPTTDKIATKAADDKYSYVFDRWDDGAVEGDLKYYRPIFHRYPFYTIVEGAESTYRLKSGKLLTIVVKRSANDETIVDDLTQVKLGKTLLQRGTDYEAKKGSLILNIKPVALNKLTAGTHHVTITFVDGEVQAKVKIKGAYDDYTGTGDNSHMFLWLALAAMGTMGLVGLRVLRKRQWE